MLNKEERKATEHDVAQPKVRIVEVKFEGALDLPEPEKAQITAKLKQTTYPHNSDWVEVSRENVRDALRDRGYIYAKVSASPNVISSDAKEKRVSLAVQVSEGSQYRLTEIEFANAHVFAPAELRKQFYMHDGDIFDLSKIREGIEHLTWLYGTRGYSNFTVEPDLRPDNAYQRISVTMHLNEDRQFRVASVEVLGLEKEVAEHAVKMTLQPGEIFSPKLFDAFFEKNKSLLPAGVPLADLKERAQVKQNTKDNTVTVVFDLRHCP